MQFQRIILAVALGEGFGIFINCLLRFYRSAEDEEALKIGRVFTNMFENYRNIVCWEIRFICEYFLLVRVLWTTRSEGLFGNYENIQPVFKQSS